MQSSNRGEELLQQSSSGGTATTTRPTHRLPHPPVTSFTAIEKTATPTTDHPRVVQPAKQEEEEDAKKEEAKKTMMMMMTENKNKIIKKNTIEKKESSDRHLTTLLNTPTFTAQLQLRFSRKAAAQGGGKEERKGHSATSPVGNTTIQGKLKRNFLPGEKGWDQPRQQEVEKERLSLVPLPPAEEKNVRLEQKGSQEKVSKKKRPITCSSSSDQKSVNNDGKKKDGNNNNNSFCLFSSSSDSLSTGGGMGGGGMGSGQTGDSGNLTRWPAPPNQHVGIPLQLRSLLQTKHIEALSPLEKLNLALKVMQVISDAMPEVGKVWRGAHGGEIDQEGSGWGPSMSENHQEERNENGERRGEQEIDTMQQQKKDRRQQEQKRKEDEEEAKQDIQIEDFFPQQFLHQHQKEKNKEKNLSHAQFFQNFPIFVPQVIRQMTEHWKVHTLAAYIEKAVRQPHEKALHQLESVCYEAKAKAHQLIAWQYAENTALHSTLKEDLKFILDVKEELSKKDKRHLPSAQFRFNMVQEKLFEMNDKWKYLREQKKSHEQLIKVNRSLTQELKDLRWSITAAESWRKYKVETREKEVETCLDAQMEKLRRLGQMENRLKVLEKEEKRVMRETEKEEGFTSPLEKLVTSWKEKAECETISKTRSLTPRPDWNKIELMPLLLSTSSSSFQQPMPVAPPLGGSSTLLNTTHNNMDPKTITSAEKKNTTTSPQSNIISAAIKVSSSPLSPGSKGTAVVVNPSPSFRGRGATSIESKDVQFAPTTIPNGWPSTHEICHDASRRLLFQLSILHRISDQISQSKKGNAPLQEHLASVCNFPLSATNHQALLPKQELFFRPNFIIAAPTNNNNNNNNKNCILGLRHYRSVKPTTTRNNDITTSTSSSIISNSTSHLDAGAIKARSPKNNKKNNEDEEEEIDEEEKERDGEEWNTTTASPPWISDYVSSLPVPQWSASEVISPGMALWELFNDALLTKSLLLSSKTRSPKKATDDAEKEEIKKTNKKRKSSPPSLSLEVWTLFRHDCFQQQLFSVAEDYLGITEQRKKLQRKQEEEEEEENKNRRRLLSLGPQETEFHHHHAEDNSAENDDEEEKENAAGEQKGTKHVDDEDGRKKKQSLGKKEDDAEIEKEIDNNNLSKNFNTTMFIQSFQPLQNHKEEVEEDDVQQQQQQREKIKKQFRKVENITMAIQGMRRTDNKKRKSETMTSPKISQSESPMAAEDHKEKEQQGLLPNVQEFLASLQYLCSIRSNSSLLFSPSNFFQLLSSSSSTTVSTTSVGQAPGASLSFFATPIPLMNTTVTSPSAFLSTKTLHNNSRCVVGSSSSPLPSTTLHAVHSSIFCFALHQFFNGMLPPKLLIVFQCLFEITGDYMKASDVRKNGKITIAMMERCIKRGYEARGLGNLMALDAMRSLAGDVFIQIVSSSGGGAMLPASSTSPYMTSPEKAALQQQQGGLGLQSSPRDVGSTEAAGGADNHNNNTQTPTKVKQQEQQVGEQEEAKQKSDQLDDGSTTPPRQQSLSGLPPQQGVQPQSGASEMATMSQMDWLQHPQLCKLANQMMRHTLLQHIFLVKQIRMLILRCAFKAFVPAASNPSRRVGGVHRKGDENDAESKVAVSPSRSTRSGSTAGTTSVPIPQTTKQTSSSSFSTPFPHFFVSTNILESLLQEFEWHPDEVMNSFSSRSVVGSNNRQSSSSTTSALNKSQQKDRSLMMAAENLSFTNNNNTSMISYRNAMGGGMGETPLEPNSFNNNNNSLFLSSTNTGGGHNLGQSVTNPTNPSLLGLSQTSVLCISGLGNSGSNSKSMNTMPAGETQRIKKAQNLVEHLKKLCFDFIIAEKREKEEIDGERLNEKAQRRIRRKEERRSSRRLQKEETKDENMKHELGTTATSAAPDSLTPEKQKPMFAKNNDQDKKGDVSSKENKMKQSASPLSIPVDSGSLPSSKGGETAKKAHHKNSSSEIASKTRKKMMLELQAELNTQHMMMCEAGSAVAGPPVSSLFPAQLLRTPSFLSPKDNNTKKGNQSSEEEKETGEREQKTKNTTTKKPNADANDDLAMCTTNDDDDDDDTNFVLWLGSEYWGKKKMTTNNHSSNSKIVGGGDVMTTWEEDDSTSSSDDGSSIGIDESAKDDNDDKSGVVEIQSEAEEIFDDSRLLLDVTIDAVLLYYMVTKVALSLYI